jgi:hypothetical protein
MPDEVAAALHRATNARKPLRALRFPRVNRNRQPRPPADAFQVLLLLGALARWREAKVEIAGLERIFILAQRRIV